MNIRQILLIIALSITASCFAQSEGNTEVRDITRLTFLNPGFAYEKKVGQFSTLYSHLFMSTGFYASFSTALGNSAKVWFDPSFNLQYRKYYNAAKREKAGKRTAMNSMNYITPVVGVTFTSETYSDSYLAESSRRPVYDVGFLWGLQRNYPKRFSLDLNVGPGYYFTRSSKQGADDAVVKETHGGFTILVHFSLGFWLNKT